MLDAANACGNPTPYIETLLSWKDGRQGFAVRALVEIFRRIGAESLRAHDAAIVQLSLGIIDISRVIFSSGPACSGRCDVHDAAWEKVFLAACELLSEYIQDFFSPFTESSNI